MKIHLFLLALACLFVPVYAQQMVKADDALLLEYYQNQRFDEAVTYLKKIYPEPVTDVKILSGLAYATQMAGKLPEADSYYQRIYATDTTNTAILFNLGAVNARRGNNVKAIGYYKKILLKDSSNFNVYNQVAVLSRGAGDIKNAIYYFEKANKINPADPDVAYDLSLFYINQKLFKKADTIITVALKADTANLILLLGKAQINYRLNRYPETVTACNQLLQSGNQTGEVINMLGNSYYNLKKYNDCIVTLKILEQNNTASETSYYYTAMSYKALGERDMAVKYFEKAIKEAVSANVNSYYAEMADSYDQLHQLKNAIKAYQKSLLYGVMPLTYYALANLYDTELKNKLLAKRYYKKYILSDPPEGQKSYVAYSKRRIGELSQH
jgi:tetratricopeptide (TPR) repeat protein